MRIQIDSVTRRFGPHTALRDLSVSFSSGELTSILGPSGCGKSTLLNIVAGILQPSSGRILFGDRDVTEMPPERRNLGFVFQNYALYPHLRVRENIGFPLQFVRTMTRAVRRDRIQELAELVKVDALLDRHPGELSGGQQQRVAIARALAKSPELLLLDEPLSNLDARLRSEMRTEIRRIQSSTGVTMLLVTHDQEDAVSMSDSVLVMREGAVEQFSTPTETYTDPRSLFVADFIGHPPASQVRAVIRDGAVVTENTVTALPLTAPAAALTHGDPLIVAIRPEAVTIDALGQGGPTGRVLSRTSSGREFLYEIEIAADVSLRALVDNTVVLEPGTAVNYRLDGGTYYFDAASGARIA